MLTLPGSSGLFAVTPAGQSAAVPISITMVQASEPEANKHAVSAARAIQLPPSATLAKPQLMQINSSFTTTPSAAQGTTAGRPALRVVIPNSRGVAGGSDVSAVLTVCFHELSACRCCRATNLHSTDNIFKMIFSFYACKMWHFYIELSTSAKASL